MENITGNITTGSKKINISLDISSNDISANLSSGEVVLTSELDTTGVELNANLTSRNTELTAEISGQGSGKPGIVDVRIDGTSIVTGQIASLSLGAGLVLNNRSLCLGIDRTPVIKPNELTIERQKELKLVLSDNGQIKHTSVNDLDFSKLTVQNIEDLTNVRINDFIFVKED